jgi:hypothetical protein
MFARRGNIRRRWLRPPHSTRFRQCTFSSANTTAPAVIEIIVGEKPVKAGIDPFNKLIDRNPKDNVKSL